MTPPLPPPHPSPDDLREARAALLRILAPLHFRGGSPPPLWCDGAQALRRIEDALGMAHTFPTRAARRRDRIEVSERG